MKKSVLFILSAFFVFSLCVFSVSGAGNVTVSGADSIISGESALYTVNIGACPRATSVSVKIVAEKGVSVTVGEWLKNGAMANFDGKNLLGAWASETETDVNGTLFMFGLKAENPSVSAKKVTVTVTAKNGKNEVFSGTVSKSVKTNCYSHTFGAWTTAKEATCTAKGTEMRTCTFCGKTETRNTDEKPHSFLKSTVTKTPTCTEKGKETGVCTVCGLQSEKEIPAKGHSVPSYSVTKTPTCTEHGTETGKCTVCGENVTKTVPAKGHSYGEFVIKKEATENEDGLKVMTCAVCGDTVEETIPALLSGSKSTGEKPGENKNTNNNTSSEKGSPMRKTVIAVGVLLCAVSLFAVVSSAFSLVLKIKEDRYLNGERT